MTTEERDLHREFEFYLANQDAIVEQYDGKVVVIRNCEVLGAYDSELAAVEATRMDHALGTFLVQRVSAGDGAYTATFNSRVALP